MDALIWASLIAVVLAFVVTFLLLWDSEDEDGRKDD